MAAQDLRLLHRDYTHSLLLAGRQWRRVANAAAEIHGISDATALPLVLIGRMDGDPRQNALAEAVGIEGPSLVRLLDQLEKAGLVLRKEDPLDRRAKVLSLTQVGRKVVARMEADLTRLREAVFADVAAADLEAGLRVFAAIGKHGREPSHVDDPRTGVERGEAAE